jgi:hypothetical protein
MLAISAPAQKPSETTKTTTSVQEDAPTKKVVADQAKPAKKVPDVKKKKEAKKEVPALAIEKAAGRVAVAPGDPNPEVLQRYRPMLWAEYHLVRLVCGLSPEQCKAIARDAEHAFQEAVAKVGIQHMRIIRNNRAGARPRHEPDDSIHEGLDRAIRAHLTPDQAKKYQAELDRRAASRKQAAIDNIAARLDEVLVLTPEQRDKLRDSLTKNWQEDWSFSPEMLLFNAHIFPMIPDKFVVPFLNESQKSIWRGLTKYGSHPVGFGFSFLNGVDHQAEDNALREAREAETKAREIARLKREAEEKAKAEEEKKKDKARSKEPAKTS